MAFYKALQGNKVLDAFDNLTMVHYNAKSHMVLICIKNAQGIVSSDGNIIWHVEGWDNFPEGEYETVSLEEITEDEYRTIRELLASGEAVEEEEQEQEEATDSTTIEWLVEEKIKSLNKACEKAIESGIDVVLDDGNSCHFTLDTNDQANISRLASQIRRGATQLIWHVDGEYCRYFSANEILSIESAMGETITYHTTYYNSLKMYVKTLRMVSDINNVAYGMPIPEEYKSEVLKLIEGG